MDGKLTTVPLVPRELFFGNPERVQGRISPDGVRLSFLAPRDGVLNVWIADIGGGNARPLTDDRGRGIHLHHWAYDNQHILYRQDRNGDENWHVYACHLDTGAVRDLTPFDNIQAQIVSLEPAFPDDILVQFNSRDPQLMDVHRLSLSTGELTLVAENPGGIVGWIPDHDLRVRAAYRACEDGGFDLLARALETDEFSRLVHWGPEDDGQPFGFTPDGEGLYVGDSRDAETIRLKVIDIASGNEQIIAEDSRTDIDDVLIHPTKHHVEAVAFHYDRKRWLAVDDSVKDDLRHLADSLDGDIDIVSRDLGDSNWLIACVRDREPVSYYHYRRGAEVSLLFSTKPALQKYPMAAMRFVEITARDGLTLPSYLTLPPGVPESGLPLVLNVHGGPWHRDTWTFHSEVQWLANRGYAVLQVNFRGSTGFGKSFLHAGDKEWGRKMQHDLTDAVQWAIGEGIADPKRVAIFGGSYGGYAALAGAAFTPDLYRCAVAMVGPSSILTWMASIPPYWKPLIKLFHTRVGNPETEEEMLKERSPLFSVDKIRIPMLIGQGANDPRVRQEESEQIVAALKAKGHEVEYALYEDEGHGLYRPENRLDFYARAERFLARHLGGRCEE
ncbi:MAG: S9 family peptidase [Candidatus Zixiibacteriota bacterium]